MPIDLAKIVQELLDKHETESAAADALQKRGAADAELGRAVAACAIRCFNQGRTKANGKSSRRREGPHRRGGMPTAAQKAGAIRATTAFTESVFNHKVRGGRTLGDVRVHELRAACEAAAAIATDFVHRGHDDAVETILYAGLSRYCVSADPFAQIRDVIKPAIATQILDAAKVTAAKVLREGSSKLAADLIAAAYEQEVPQPPASPTPPPGRRRGGEHHAR